MFAGGIIALPTERDAMKDVQASRWSVAADEKQADLLQSLAASQQYMIGTGFVSASVKETSEFHHPSMSFQ